MSTAIPNHIVDVILKMSGELGEVKGVVHENQTMLVKHSRDIDAIREKLVCTLHTDQLKELASAADSWREYLIKQRSVIMVVRRIVGAMIVMITLAGSISACILSWRTAHSAAQTSLQQNAQDTRSKDHGKNTAKALP